MSAPPSAPPAAYVRWRSVPTVRNPHDECRVAREAFARVAPGGVLPGDPTPLQRMVHTRMVTSAFIAAMAERVVDRSGAAPCQRVEL